MNLQPVSARARSADRWRIAAGLLAVAALQPAAATDAGIAEARQLDSVMVTAITEQRPVNPQADAEIADVRTIAELRQVKPIALPGGGEVRLGLAGSGADGGPWMLLYCLEKGTSAPLRRNHGGGLERHEPLGSVYFAVKPPPLMLKGEVLLAQQAALMAQSVEARAEASEPLYCARVVTALCGTYEISVYEQGGQLLQRKNFEVRTPRSCYWLELADQGSRELRPKRAMSHLKRTSVRGRHRTPDRVATERMAGAPCAALPKFEGDSSIARFGGDVMSFGGRSFRLSGLLKQDSIAPDANLLPGGIPLDDRLANAFHMDAPRPGESLCHLQIAMEGDELIVQSSAVDLEDWDVEQPFLARWWLNGQSVLPMSDLREIAEAQADQRPEQAEIALKSLMDAEELWVSEKCYRFVLPRIFRSLRVGDSIKLQVLYCPEEYDRLYETIFGDEEQGRLLRLRDKLVSNRGTPVPLLSNVMELIVTDANPDAPKVKTRGGITPNQSNGGR